MGADKRHETPGSEMEDFITHRTVSSMNIVFVSVLFDPTPIGATQKSAVEALQTLGFVTPEEAKFRNQNLLKWVISKPAGNLPFKETLSLLHQTGKKKTLPFALERHYYYI